MIYALTICLQMETVPELTVEPTRISTTTEAKGSVEGEGWTGDASWEGIVHTAPSTQLGSGEATTMVEEEPTVDAMDTPKPTGFHEMNMKKAEVVNGSKVVEDEKVVEYEEIDEKMEVNVHPARQTMC